MFYVIASPIAPSSENYGLVLPNLVAGHPQSPREHLWTPPLIQLRLSALAPHTRPLDSRPLFPRGNESCMETHGNVCAPHKPATSATTFARREGNEKMVRSAKTGQSGDSSLPH